MTTGVLGSLQIIAPVSVYSQLAQLPAKIRVDLSGRAAVKVPSRAPAPAAAPPLVGEGQPILIRQLGLSNVVPDFRAGNSLARSVMARGASELIMIRKMAAAPIPRVTFIVTRGSF